MQYKQFSIEERELIQELMWGKQSVRAIARRLCRSPSSVSREINRNIPPLQRRYAPRLAHQRALKKRASRGRQDRLKTTMIRDYVITHLKTGWSPEQIAGRIRIDIPHATISHEAIYQYVYAQIYQGGHGYLRPGCEDLRPYLRRKQKRRRCKGFRRAQRIAYARDGISIDQRPAIVASRSRIGDWEGDTIESCDHRPGVNTLLERQSGLVCITKLSDKTSASAMNAMTKRLSIFPQTVCQTVTLDNGPENRRWRLLEMGVGICCFFAHAYHSWERGCNENVNGLIREYFPKGTDFCMISESALAMVEDRLNTRPRKRLGWRTPLEIFSVALES